MAKWGFFSLFLCFSLSFSLCFSFCCSLSLFISIPRPFYQISRSFWYKSASFSGEMGFLIDWVLINGFGELGSLFFYKCIYTFSLFLSELIFWSVESWLRFISLFFSVSFCFSMFFAVSLCFFLFLFVSLYCSLFPSISLSLSLSLFPSISLTYCFPCK